MVSNIMNAMVRFELVQPGLQARILSTGSDGFANFNLLGIIQHGSVTVSMEDNHQITESSIFCIPHKKHAKVMVPPGCQMWLLGYSDKLTFLVNGSDLDASKLNVLMRQFTITHCDKKDIDESFLPLLRLLEIELTNTNKGSRTITCSIIRILLVSLYRLSDIDTIRLTHSPDELILQQFRQLVEVEYQNRRTVYFYCQTLSLTYDRLHAVCQRNLNKTPLQLINNRILMEATFRLKESSSSIQAIANSLGYQDASQFSHFFKKEVGISPSQFKRIYSEKKGSAFKEAKQDFSDWP